MESWQTTCAKHSLNLSVNVNREGEQRVIPNTPLAGLGHKEISSTTPLDRVGNLNDYYTDLLPIIEVQKTKYFHSCFNLSVIFFFRFRPSNI